MTRRNVFDKQAEYMAHQMDKFSGYLETLSEDVEPFDSQQLSPDEEDLLYDHPSTLFGDEVSVETGMPLSDAEAAQQLLEQMGPVEYVRFVEGVAKRRAKGA